MSLRSTVCSGGPAIGKRKACSWIQRSGPACIWPPQRESRQLFPSPRQLRGLDARIGPGVTSPRGVTPVKSLRVVLVKPSKYAADGAVERFRRGFMPNSTLPYLASLTPAAYEVHAIDEYVETDLAYLDLLAPT